ncbi:MAG: MATE family efflux transporter [Bacillota bacterium]
MEKGIKKFIGDKHFYKHVFIIVAPIVVQQLLFSLGGYVDNLMVNAYGGNSLAYGGVSSANRLVLIFNFLFIGLSAASSIFLSQYFGAGNSDGIKATFNLGWISAIIVGGLASVFIHFFGNSIVDIYIQDPISRAYGYQYLKIIKFGMIIWAVNMALSTSFRTVKQTMLPMIVGICGICINTGMNYILIFGNFGFAEMGAEGAAIATVSSRIFEATVLLMFAIFWKKSYFKGFIKHVKLKKELIVNYMKRGFPLVANELLWATMVAVLIIFTTYKNDTWYTSYAYALNICDLFFVFFSGLANGTAIIVGPQLGISDFQGAKRDANRMRGLSVVVGVVMAIFMVILSPFVLQFFSPTAEIESLAIKIIIVVAVFLPSYSYNATSFFILRAGGDSLRAFLLDQGATILIALPISIFMGVNAVSLGVTVVEIYLASHIADVLKVFIGTRFVKNGKWLKNITV